MTLEERAYVKNIVLYSAKLLTHFYLMLYSYDENAGSQSLKPLTKLKFSKHLAKYIFYSTGKAIP